MEIRPENPFQPFQAESLNLVRNDLSRVLCQVAFPSLASIADLSFVGAFQQAIKATYPTLVPEQMNTVNIGPQGAQMVAEPVWRFHDAQQVWRVSLMSAALVLETRTYVSRSDFMRRLSPLLDALGQHVRPAQVARIGVRYINHVRLASPADAASVFRQGVVGEALLAAASIPGARHMLNEIAGELPDGGMATARWAILPPGGTHDGNVMPPMPVTSCMLDIDSFVDWNAAPRPFDPSAVLSEAKRLAGHGNGFFRWAVSDGHLKELSVPEYRQPGVWQATAQFH